MRFHPTYTATTRLSPLSLHDALPISPRQIAFRYGFLPDTHGSVGPRAPMVAANWEVSGTPDFRWGHRGSLPFRFLMERRSEEHTSELQSLRHLVCRRLLDKKIVFSGG